MQPRVTYWTGVWQPDLEALSKEVDLLRRQHGRLSPVVSVAARQRSEWRPHERVLKLAGHRHLLLHLVAAGLERRGDVTHAFGHVNDWHLLRTLGRRPIVYTAALPGSVLDTSLLGKVAVFAAESQPIANTLAALGVPASRIEVVYPGSDLSAFSAAPAPRSDRFRVLFASTPADVAEFNARGILLMVEAARQARDVEFVFLWRNWGDREGASRVLASLHPPSNLVVEMGDVADMPGAYRDAHAVICFYADGFGKSCPNSVVEGLACGRPAILSPGVGVASLIAEHGAGVVVQRSVEAMLGGIRELRREFDAFSRRARALAEAHFGLEAFLGRYDQLYERAARRPTAR